MSMDHIEEIAYAIWIADQDAPLEERVKRTKEAFAKQDALTRHKLRRAAKHAFNAMFHSKMKRDWGLMWLATAYRIVSAEKLEDDPNTPEDAAYNRAIDDCLEAIARRADELGAEYED